MWAGLYPQKIHWIDHLTRYDHKPSHARVSPSSLKISMFKRAKQKTVFD